MPYCHRVEVFAGKPQNIEEAEYYIPGVPEVTLNLIDKVANHSDFRGKNVAFDNLYTSILLAKELLDRGITCVGTMRHNRKGSYE